MTRRVGVPAVCLFVAAVVIAVWTESLAAGLAAWSALGFLEAPQPGSRERSAGFVTL